MATILIVDDNAANRDFLVTLLDYSGHRMIEAADGMMGLVLTRNEQPDLVIVDILMPAMDGFEFVRQLRDDPVIGHTPVIFCTATYLKGEARALAEACHVRHILTKPTEPQLVLDVVAAVLNTPQPVLPPVPSAKELFNREHLRVLTDKLVEKVEQLQDSQAQLVGIIASAMDAIISVDERQQIIVFNQAAEQLFAYHASEVIDQPLSKLIPERFRSRHEGHIHEFGHASVMHRSMRPGGNLYGLRRDGTEFPIETSISQVEVGGRLLYTVILRDITERKQRERQLEAIATVSAALRAAHTRAEILPIVLDVVHELLADDAAALSIRDPLSGDSVINWAQGAWASRINERIPAGEGISGHVLATGQPYWNNDIRHEVRYTRSDLIGDLKAMVCVPLITEAQTIGVLWIARKSDITQEEVRLLMAMSDIAANAIQRVTLYEQTQEEARRVQQIIDTVPEGVFVLDANQQVMMANPTAQTYLTLLAGAQVGDVLTMLGTRPLAELLVKVEPGKPWPQLDFPEAHRIFEIAASPINIAVATEGQVVVLRDVTEAHTQARYLQAQERLATVGQLAAGVAHDLNNVLAAIVLYAQMMQLAVDFPPAQASRLEIIVQQANHASELIQQILDFSRNAVMTRYPTDFLILVQNAVKLFQRTFPENIVVSLHYTKEDYIIDADATRLQQVIMNLAVNARDAMPSGGDLQLLLHRLVLKAGEKPPLPDMAPGNWIKLTVRDNGMGMRPQILARIFDPFFTTKAPGKGTGLGLSQVYGIVKQHGGSITVRSEVGQGTTFTLYLPALEGVEEQSSAFQGELLIRGQGEVILVVEDKKEVRQALSELLIFLGYQVLAAADGQQALSLFAAHEAEVALVLSDMVMPDMGGAELYAQLKARYPAVKMVITTGYPLQEVGNELLQQGVVVGIQKPFAIGKIAHIVREALDEL
ncbi:MAG: response regulator [Candidatus Promineifilaceae bacterium]